MLISQQLSTIAQQNAARSAIRYLGKETNYTELKATIARLSYLYQIEIGHGSRVAFLTRNSLAVVTSFFALSNIRAITIPVDPELPPEEVIPWLKAAKPTHLAVTNDLITHAKNLLHEAHLGIPIVEIEKKHGGEYDSSFTPSPDNVPVEHDVILQLRTSGTTGEPKFASFTHKQLHHAMICLRGLYHSMPTDRYCTTMNWSHPFAFVHGMLFPLLTGGTCVIDHGLKAAEFLDFLLDSRVTRLIGTPPFFLKLLNTCRTEKKFLPGTKSVTVGVGTLSNELRKAFGMLKIAVMQCYGQTENLWTIALEEAESGKSEDAPHGGRALAGLKYKVLDAQGDEVEGKGAKIGQLAVTGPTVMNGYMDRDKETKSALRGTWLYTGDICKLDGDSDELRITFLGRKEDVIEVDGEPTLPSRVDKVLKAISGVKDAACFVVKNSKNETVVGTAVVKAPGAPLTEKQVMESCGKQLSGTLMPKAVAFTDVIPRDMGGNIEYARLRGQFGSIVG